MAEEEIKKSYYGKRPMWQWVLIYFIIGAIVYGAIYYFFLANKGGYDYQAPQQDSSQNSPYSK